MVASTCEVFSAYKEVNCWVLIERNGLSIFSERRGDESLSKHNAWTFPATTHAAALTPATWRAR
jgi:hypothetical protein